MIKTDRKHVNPHVSNLLNVISYSLYSVQILYQKPIERGFEDYYQKSLNYMWEIQI